VQALRSFDRVAVSPACKPQSGPSASCARAARAPDTTSPRGERSRRRKLTSRRITRRHLTPQTHTSRRRRSPPPPINHCAQARCGPCACACAATPCPTRQGRRWRVRRSPSAPPEPPATPSAVSTPRASRQATYAPFSRAAHPLPPHTRPAAVQALRRPRGARCQLALLPLRSPCVLLAHASCASSQVMCVPRSHARRDAPGTALSCESLTWRNAAATQRLPAHKPMPSARAPESPARGARCRRAPRRRAAGGARPGRAAARAARGAWSAPPPGAWCGARAHSRPACRG
jgi:hypothetical protein